MAGQALALVPEALRLDWRVRTAQVRARLRTQMRVRILIGRLTD